MWSFFFLVKYFLLSLTWFCGICLLNGHQLTDHDSLCYGTRVVPWINFINGTNDVVWHTFWWIYMYQHVNHDTQGVWESALTTQATFSEHSMWIEMDFLCLTSVDSWFFDDHSNHWYYQKWLQKMLPVFLFIYFF